MSSLKKSRGEINYSPVLCYFYSLDQNTGSSQFVFLWLDVRKFASFLASDQMNPDQVTLGEHKMTFLSLDIFST